MHNIKYPNTFIRAYSNIVTIHILVLLRVSNPSVDVFSRIIAAMLDYEAKATIESNQKIWIELPMNGRETAAVNSLTSVLWDMGLQFSLEKFYGG